ncbi:hypothetical protein RDI58_028504 [Solanum bulbocastanum]|uniref:Pectinesterase inhibitor domain-containing protein n=1 Tax=Solanum bulbocastanum TaxID=147425 RepID=A0AAN8SUC1_SOLBU
MASSSFSLCSSLILCIVCAFLAIQTGSNPLADVCAKTGDLAFCLIVLNDFSHLNLHDLTQATINLAGANASAIGAKIEILLRRTENQTLESTYILCSNYYSEAIRKFYSAKQYMKMGQYENVYIAAIVIANDAYNCQRAFELYFGYDLIIAKENDNFEKISSIVVSAASLLLHP